MANPTIRIATARDMDDVYRLVHDTYVAEGYIDPQADGRFTDHYHLDDIPQTTVYVADLDGEVVGTIAWTLDGPCKLPTDVDFPEETKQFRLPGSTLVATWRFATARHVRNRISMALLLIEAAARDGVAAGVTDTLCALNPHHERLYSTMLNMKVIARVSVSQGLQIAPAVLMHNTIDDIKAFLAYRDKKVNKGE